MSHAPAAGAAVVASHRLAVVDALKALAAQLIVLHHALLYGPLANALEAHWSAPANWLQQYGRFAVQVFLVLGGYLAAGGLARAFERPHALPQLLLRRHSRLALPFLAALLLTLLMHALTAPWLPELLPGELGLGQLLGHALLLHGVLNQEALTVGAWYVAIDFQLYLLLALLLRQRHATVWIAAFCLLSAFAFNRWSGGDAWAPYFFAAYGLGALVQRLGGLPRRHRWLGLLALSLGAALALDFRGRLALALATALLLAATQWSGARLPAALAGGAARHGGRSYALFLVHFPVLLGVNALVRVLGLDGPWTALAAFALAWWGANAAARVFCERIEQPAARWDPWRHLLRPRVLALLPLAGLLAGAGSAFEALRLA